MAMYIEHRVANAGKEVGPPTPPPGFPPAPLVQKTMENPMKTKNFVNNKFIPMAKKLVFLYVIQVNVSSETYA